MNDRLIKFLLGLVLLSGFLLRLYKWDIPLADHHSWRQADTAAVARNYIKEGWNFLEPRIDNFVPLHPGEANNERLFLVEPPIYNSIVAGVYSLLGIEERWARLVSILFSLGSSLFLFLLASYYFGGAVGLLSVFFFEVLPYNIFYSRVILPEPMIIFLTLGMFYFLIRWLENKNNKYFILWIVFSAVSFSQKSFPWFLILPQAYLIFNEFRLKTLRLPKMYFWAIFSLTPFLVWRWWISRFPEGVPANLWLFNQGNIRFKGAFFWWIFAERIGKLILGYWGLPLLVLGLVIKPKKESWFFHLWLISIMAYVFVFAAGNVTHDYYQIPLVPIFCIFLARGADYLLSGVNKSFSRLACYLLVTTCFVFMIAFSWYEVRGFYNIQGGVDLAGIAVDQLTPKTALVMTGDSNDATLLYNTNRWGWSGGYASAFPNQPEVVEKLIQSGASYYVTTKFDRNSDFGRYLLTNYPLIKETDQFILFKLTKVSQ